MYGIQIAFKSYFFLQGIWRSPWVGFENFALLFSQPSFWQVLRNTILISLLKLLFNYPAPIMLALLINELPFGRFKKMTQTITYLPHFISWVVLGGLFLQLLSPSIGPVNIVIKALGLRPVFFLADPTWFRGVLVVTAMWKEIGWSSIIYLAAIASINPELYEAAIVDGASRFRRAISITLPSLTPVITVLLIFALQGIIGDDFDQIFNLYNPSVYQVGDVLSTFVYRMGLLNMQYSYATAVGLFRNIIAFAILIGANAAAKRINEYGIW
jgi:putative aldouronate transport system permease protein